MVFLYLRRTRGICAPLAMYSVPQCIKVTICLQPVATIIPSSIRPVDVYYECCKAEIIHRFRGLPKVTFPLVDFRNSLWDPILTFPVNVYSLVFFCNLQVLFVKFLVLSYFLQLFWLAISSSFRSSEGRPVTERKWQVIFAVNYTCNLAFPILFIKEIIHKTGHFSCEIRRDIFYDLLATLLTFGL
jgi:hypothetical protein